MNVFTQEGGNGKNEFTTVSGLGLWGNWTRSFKTPLQACLDLIDNAFDAALKPNNDGSMFEGKIIVDREFHQSPDQVGSTVASVTANGTGSNYTRESIIITNNAKDPMKPLGEALKIYNSVKLREEEIGENGVGLKQGCAALSDINFIFTRSGTELGVGFVCKELQRVDGCWLPSFSFSVECHPDDADEVRNQMKGEVDAIIESEEPIASLLKRVGGKKSLIDNLCEIYSHDEWKSEDYVFRLYLADMKHRNPTEATGGKEPCLIDDLKEQLPIYYIHVPVEMTVMVDGEEMSFSYWQRRLIEMSRLKIHINKNQFLHEFENQDPTWITKGYELTVYCGFDSLRASRKGNTALSLYLYSRRSGRLINKIDDARHLLGLQHSGSDFCQGLTIIVDDFHGNLPLDPVKQNIAFSEEDGARAHEANFYAWISGVSKFYWNFHADKYSEGKKKTLLGEAIKRAKPFVEKEVAATNTYIMSLGRAALTRFEGVPWSKKKKTIHTGVVTSHIFGPSDAAGKQRINIIHGTMRKEFRLIPPQRKVSARKSAGNPSPLMTTSSTPKRASVGRPRGTKRSLSLTKSTSNGSGKYKRKESSEGASFSSYMRGVQDDEDEDDSYMDNGKANNLYDSDESIEDEPDFAISSSKPATVRRNSTEKASPVVPSSREAELELEVKKLEEKLREEQLLVRQLSNEVSMWKSKATQNPQPHGHSKAEEVLRQEAEELKTMITKMAFEREAVARERDDLLKRLARHEVHLEL